MQGALHHLAAMRVRVVAHARRAPCTPICNMNRRTNTNTAAQRTEPSQPKALTTTVPMAIVHILRPAPAGRSCQALSWLVWLASRHSATDLRAPATPRRRSASCPCGAHTRDVSQQQLAVRSHRTWALSAACSCAKRAEQPAAAHPNRLRQPAVLRCEGDAVAAAAHARGAARQRLASETGIREGSGTAGGGAGPVASEPLSPRSQRPVNKTKPPIATPQVTPLRRPCNSSMVAPPIAPSSPRTPPPPPPPPD